MIFRKPMFAALISVIFATAPNHANACARFGPPDKGFWTEHATIIVDATVEGFYRKPLGKGETFGIGYQETETWVLKLNVHKTLRGAELRTRHVATRFSNTTIVDEEYVDALVGYRREFALVNYTHKNSSAFSTTSLEDEFPPRDDLLPPHDGIFVMGESV